MTHDVTDGLVTGSMLSAAVDAYDAVTTYSICDNKAMIAALEAALRSQGKVVSVVDLDKLARKWDAKSVRDYGQKSSHAGDLRKLLTENGVNYVSGGDLTAIIGEGD